MYTGRDALSSIEQAISRARTDEGQLDTTLRSAMDDAARLRREEAEGFRALARLRLDTMASEKIIGALDATEQRALAMMESHREAQASLVRRHDETQAALDRAEADKHDRDQALADALQALDQQRQMTATRAKASPDWQAAVAAVEGATKIAANADEKASRAEADLTAKRQPYEADSLFVYLWQKKHGQAEDTSGYLVRYVDRRIARLVGFSEARANYAMLQDIPTRLREHAQGKQQDVVAARTHVAAVERAALVADGIEAIEARVAAAEVAVKDGAAAIVKINADLEAVDAERQNRLGSGDQATYGGAVDLLAQELAHDDIYRLYSEASMTPTPADDQVVNAIKNARAAYEKADSDIARIRASIRDMADRRRKLELSRDRARNNGYEDPRGTFGDNGDAVLDVIGGILSGVVRSGILDHMLSDNHRSSGGSSWPGSWGSGSSGSSSSSSSDSGSGWRTGGSF